MHQQRNPAQPSVGRRPEPVRAYAAMNTVRALECLAFTALSAPQLADSLQVSVRTARRLLKRLAIEGFVIQERDHRRRYHPTLRLAALGQQMLDHAPLTGRRTARRPARSRHLMRGTSRDRRYEGQVVCAVHADTNADQPTLCGFGATRNVPPNASRAQVAGLTAHRHANPATTQRERRGGRPDGSAGSPAPQSRSYTTLPQQPQTRREPCCYETAPTCTHPATSTTTRSPPSPPPCFNTAG